MPFQPTLAQASRRERLQSVKLQAGLAAATLHRSRLTGVAFIGVTGSCGKTTTKELIAATLDTEFRGRRTPGEGNGLAVVAKTVLRTTKRDRFCVLEVAAREPGGVARTARVIRPRIVVVTHIGGDHRKTFRTLEATAAEKRALLTGAADGATAVLNLDDPLVRLMAQGHSGPVLSFGCSPEAVLQAQDVRSPWPERLSFTVHFRGRSVPVSTRLCGKHWVSSALAALGVAIVMGVPLEQAADALATAEPPPGRMTPVLRHGVTFMRDDVKAPLWTMEAAFEFMAQARAARKIAVIGTISDMSGASSRKYRSAARGALAAVDEAVFVGPNAHYVHELITTARPGALLAFATVPEAIDHLRARLREGDLVLLKGSSVDRLHRIASLYGSSAALPSGPTTAR